MTEVRLIEFDFKDEILGGIYLAENFKQFI